MGKHQLWELCPHFSRFGGWNDHSLKKSPSGTCSSDLQSRSVLWSPLQKGAKPVSKHFGVPWQLLEATLKALQMETATQQTWTQNWILLEPWLQNPRNVRKTKQQKSFGASLSVSPSTLKNTAEKNTKNPNGILRKD